MGLLDESDPLSGLARYLPRRYKGPRALSSNITTGLDDTSYINLSKNLAEILFLRLNQKEYSVTCGADRVNNAVHLIAEMMSLF